MRWRLLATPPLGGAENMAIDEVLLRRAGATGEAVLRVYAWAGPTLSLGRNQPARDEYQPAALREHGVSVVRRITGGRAVLHHREVTYSVTAPEALGSALRDAYARINEILVRGLRSLGVDAAIAIPNGRAPLPSTAPCFEEPTEGELVLGARKLVGSAQYREGGALLQHGSILVEDDQAMLHALATAPLPEIPPAATLRAALGRAPAVAEVAAALFEALRALEDPAATPLADDALEAEAAQRRPRYLDDTWTWRR